MSRLRATYRIRAPASEVASIADNLALEQSVEVAARVVTDPFVAAEVMGRVEMICPQGEGDVRTVDTPARHRDHRLRRRADDQHAVRQQLAARARRARRRRLSRPISSRASRARASASPAFAQALDVHGRPLDLRRAEAPGLVQRRARGAVPHARRERRRRRSRTITAWRTRPTRRSPSACSVPARGRACVRETGSSVPLRAEPRRVAARARPPGAHRARRGRGCVLIAPALVGMPAFDELVERDSTCRCSRIPRMAAPRGSPRRC